MVEQIKQDYERKQIVSLANVLKPRVLEIRGPVSSCERTGDISRFYQTAYFHGIASGHGVTKVVVVRGRRISSLLKIRDFSHENAEPRDREPHERWPAVPRAA